MRLTTEESWFDSLQAKGILSSPNRPYRFWGLPQPPVVQGLFGLKLSKRKVNHSPPSTAEVNVWNYISSPHTPSEFPQEHMLHGFLSSPVVCPERLWDSSSGSRSPFLVVSCPESEPDYYLYLVLQWRMGGLVPPLSLLVVEVLAYARRQFLVSSIMLLLRWSWTDHIVPFVSHWQPLWRIRMRGAFLAVLLYVLMAGCLHTGTVLGWLASAVATWASKRPYLEFKFLRVRVWTLLDG
jgi:hypothetical protein